MQFRPIYGKQDDREFNCERYRRQFCYGEHVKKAAGCEGKEGKEK